MLASALFLLTGLQAPEGADVEVRVILLGIPRGTLPLGGIGATLILEDPAGPSRGVPLTLTMPRGFDRLDGAAPRQVRPVEGTSWRAGLRVLPLPVLPSRPTAARAEPVAGPYFRAFLRREEIPPGEAASVLFELPDGVAWARGFTIRPEPVSPEPARAGR